MFAVLATSAEYAGEQLSGVSGGCFRGACGQCGRTVRCGICRSRRQQKAIPFRRLRILTRHLLGRYWRKRQVTVRSCVTAAPKPFLEAST